MRPLDFKTFYGQENIKKHLNIIIEASIISNSPLPHMLFYSPPGKGKNSIIEVIKNEYNSRVPEEKKIKVIPAIAIGLNKIDDIINILVQLRKDSYDIVFIDEIHRLPINIEEVLYPVMEDFKIQTKKKMCGKTLKTWQSIPPFTLCGATTKLSLLSQPLRDRFGLKIQLEDYELADLGLIALYHAITSGIDILPEACLEIALRSRKTPRVAVHYVHRAREFAIVKNKNVIDMEVINEMFDMLEIDKIGLTKQDYRLLFYLANANRPIGLKGLSALLNEDEQTIEDVIEPWLIKLELIIRTPRGRVISEEGINWLSNIKGEQNGTGKLSEAHIE